MSTQAEPQPEPRRAQSRGRATVVWAVLVLAGLLLLLSSFAVWINRVALNTGVFTDTSSSLLDNDQIRRAVANRAVRFVVSADISLLERCAISAQPCATTPLPATASVKRPGRCSPAVPR